MTTGISAADRATTILAASAPGAEPRDIVMPGHVFPILVKRGGVLFKAALSEAAVDLVGLAEGGDSAALCAILDDEGAVATSEQLTRFAKGFGLESVTVGEVVAHRLAFRTRRRAHRGTRNRKSRSVADFAQLCIATSSITTSTWRWLRAICPGTSR